MIRWSIVAVFFLVTLYSVAHAQLSIISGPAPSTSSIPNVLVAGLPACSATNLGQVYVVTNALTPTILVAVVGGGAVVILVHCNGTAFVAG